MAIITAWSMKGGVEQSMNKFAHCIKTIVLWFILRFNRDKSYFELRQTIYSVWLTAGERYFSGAVSTEGLRLNYTAPFGGGSVPVRKMGFFSYQTFVWPGGKHYLEQITGDAVDEIDEWCSPIWVNFLKAPWTLGARKTTR